jgi:imidazolonepropionase-like amidohydrolase
MLGLSSRKRSLMKLTVRERGAGGARSCLVTSLVALALGSSPLVTGQESAAPVFVVRGGTLWSDGLGFVQSGAIVVRNGRIEAVGASVPVPPGATVIDATNSFILPGLIDAHTQLGLRGDSIGWDTDEDVRPLTPEMRVLDAFYPFGRDVREARSGGVTTALVAPGGKNVIGGEASIVKLTDSSFESSVIRPRAALKMSLGEEPKRAAVMPKTRMGQIYLLRDHLEKARDYAEKRRNADPGEPDARYEGTAALLAGEIPAIVQVYRAADISNLLRLADEFGFRCIVVYGYEAHLVAPELKRRHVPVVISPIKGLWYRQEKDTFEPLNAETLLAAGVRIAFQGGEGHPYGFRDLLLSAGYAMKFGVKEEDALRAVTSWPAEILGVGERVGRLAPGLDADFIVLSGRPFDLRTKMQHVFIDGRQVYTQ